MAVIERFTNGKWEPSSNQRDLLRVVGVNDIGIAGQAGFGVGISPNPPDNCQPMPGCFDKLSPNYGNYQFADGSISVWIPAFWVRFGALESPNYPKYGANAVDVRPLSAFANAQTAAGEGFYLHRAFINAGKQQAGVWRDKFTCSKNGNIASSIPGAKPVVSGPAAGEQDGFADCTGNGQTPANNYGGALEAAKSRGDKWFCSSAFVEAAIFALTMAHGQAATSDTYCKWFDETGVSNFPKGNNNYLTDVNDNTVTYESAEVSAMTYLGKTGSGTPFAKTTHNGQECGIADINGNYWRILTGITCNATTKIITAATQTNPVKITIVGHGWKTGDLAMVIGVEGMDEIKDRIWRITRVDDDNFTLDGADGTGFGAYTGGGSVTVGTFLMLKPEADIAALTSATSGPKGHWSPEAHAALFEEFEPGFRTDYPNNGFVQRLGNGANEVFGWANETERRNTMALVPKADGVSLAGTVLMGSDYAYQYIRNLLCVIAGGNGYNGSAAGVGCRYWYLSRSSSRGYVSFAASRYP